MSLNPNTKEGKKRQEEDSKTISQFLSELKIITGNINPVIRLGAFVPGRVRPLRFSVHDGQKKQEILMAAKNLRVNGNKSVDRSMYNFRIYPDRTPAERERYRAQQNENYRVQGRGTVNTRYFSRSSANTTDNPRSKASKEPNTVVIVPTKGDTIYHQKDSQQSCTPSTNEHQEDNQRDCTSGADKQTR